MSSELCAPIISTRKSMDKSFRLLLPFLIFFALQACQSAQFELGKTGMPGKIPSDYFAKMRDFQIDNIELDYIADCKARIKTAKESHSGSCRIVLTHDQQLRLTVNHPLGGMIMSFYVNKEIIQVLNRSEKTFYEMANNEINRRRVPAMMNLSLGSLQEVLWGRKIFANDSSLFFHFRNKKPHRVIKTGEHRQLTVLYKSWLQYERAWFPKLLLLEDQQQKTSIKLAITRFTPGFAGNIKIEKIPKDYRKGYIRDEYGP